jgi:hypothetical protein
VPGEPVVDGIWAYGETSLGPGEYRWDVQGLAHPRARAAPVGLSSMTYQILRAGIWPVSCITKFELGCCRR